MIHKPPGRLTPWCRHYDAAVAKTVRVARAADATKLTETIFRAVNIALVNELKIVYDKMGIDVCEVLDAANTEPFGFSRVPLLALRARRGAASTSREWDGRHAPVSIARC
jgi:hypothetical protein